MNRRDYLSCFDLTLERLFSHRSWATNFFQVHPLLRADAIETANRCFYDLAMTPEAAADKWFMSSILSKLIDARPESKFCKHLVELDYEAVE